MVLLHRTRQWHLAVGIALAALAMAVVLAQDASLAHQHDEAGLYSEDCPLRYLATLGSPGPVAAPVAIAPDVVVLPAAPPFEPTLTAVAVRVPCCRAPPSA